MTEGPLFGFIQMQNTAQGAHGLRALSRVFGGFSLAFINLNDEIPLQPYST